MLTTATSIFWTKLTLRVHKTGQLTGWTILFDATWLADLLNKKDVLRCLVCLIVMHHISSGISMPLVNINGQFHRVCHGPHLRRHGHARGACLKGACNKSPSICKGDDRLNCSETRSTSGSGSNSWHGRGSI